jgi:hypothetical protein
MYPSGTDIAVCQGFRIRTQPRFAELNPDRLGSDPELEPGTLIVRDVLAPPTRARATQAINNPILAGNAILPIACCDAALDRLVLVVLAARAAVAVVLLLRGIANDLSTLSRHIVYPLTLQEIPVRSIVPLCKRDLLQELTLSAWQECPSFAPQYIS